MMPRDSIGPPPMHIHVCSLGKLDETVRLIRPNRLISLVRVEPPIATPETIAREHHLRLSFHDIVAPEEGQVAPGAHHVEELLDFARGWDREAPMLIHCYAGISRSTAAAFIVACALRPDVAEESLALALRRASPSATPNTRLVALADERLGRDGRMTAAIRDIGRGADAFEGRPFRLPIGEA